jgi:hypothetical protein
VPRARAIVLTACLFLVACSSTPHRDEVDPRPPPAAIPAELFSPCEELGGVDAAICRTEARQGFARGRRDTVLVACLNGPHQRLVAIRDGAPDAGPDGPRLGDVMTEREVLRLEREAEACPGD